MFYNIEHRSTVEAVMWYANEPIQQQKSIQFFQHLVFAKVLYLNWIDNKFIVMFLMDYF